MCSQPHDDIPVAGMALGPPDWVQTNGGPRASRRDRRGPSGRIAVLGDRHLSSELHDSSRGSTT